MAIKLHEYLLLPFAGMYGLAVLIRNKLFDWEVLPSTEFSLPIISVGNLAVGGTGKTPHIEFLVSILKEEYTLAVLSRGYKRKTKGFLLADHNSGPDQIGDEPCQIKNKFPEIIVAVDEKRVRGVKKLMELKPGPEVILLDDAFQHRHIKAGMNILLDDYNRPALKDFLLPAGRLREPFSSRKRANIILVTKSPASVKAIEMRIRARETDLDEFQHLYYTRIAGGQIKPVFNGDFNKFKDNKPEILLISGIANPRTVKPLVRNISTKIKDLIFKDHHDYSAADADMINTEFRKLNPENSIILTTEKDAVKLKELDVYFTSVMERMFYFPISVEFLNNDEGNFVNQIKNYVKSNKRDSILHKK